MKKRRLGSALLAAALLGAAVLLWCRREDPPTLPKATPPTSIAAAAKAASAERADARSAAPVEPNTAPNRTGAERTAATIDTVVYRGRVVHGERGISDAEVIIRPDLEAYTTAVPPVLRGRTDANGWFECAGAAPPVWVQAIADGHRRPPARHLLQHAGELRFELEPLPVVRGRVVDASTRQPLADAHVRLVELDEPREVGMPLPCFEPTPATAVQADGSFVRTIETTYYAFAVIAAGYPGTVAGPFPLGGTEDHTIPMVRGAVVNLRAFWKEQPLPVAAQLLADDDRDTVPHVQASVPLPNRADAFAALPPVPCGRWLLRVEAEGPARFEQWLDLHAPGEHFVTARLTDGAQLIGKLASEAAGEHDILCVHADGTVRRVAIATDGTFVVPALHPGQWTAAALRRTRASYSSRNGKNLALALALAEDSFEVRPGEVVVRHDVTDPSTRYGTVVADTSALAAGTTLELVPQDDLQRRVPEPLRRFDSDASGRTELGPLPAGTWQLRIGGSSPSSPLRVVEVVAGRTTEVVLQP